MLYIVDFIGYKEIYSRFVYYNNNNTKVQLILYCHFKEITVIQICYNVMFYVFFSSSFGGSYNLRNNYKNV